MAASPTLETERLVSRPFRDDDLVDYFAMMDSPEVRTAMRIPDDAGMPEAFDAMAAWLGQWALRGTGHWALEEKDSGQFVRHTTPCENYSTRFGAERDSRQH